MLGARTAAAVVCATVLGLVSACPALGSASQQESPAVLAVWALADGDTPVADGRVRVLAAGRPLRQVAEASERTHEEGMALLEFASLPDRFTVEVSGGRVGGRRLRGTLRSEVDGYRSGGVVHVSPVTTLIADHVAAHRARGRPITTARARREIYRLLRIPRWQDAADLRSSDEFFDGDAYLRAVRAAGGVEALNRALVRQEMRAGDDPRRFRPGGRRARAAAVDWLALLTGDPKVLVKEAFKALALLGAQKIGGLAAEKAGKAALGWVLAAFGYGDVLKDQDMAEIKLALEALGKQLTAMQGQIQVAAFSTLVHQTDRTIGQIDHASSQLALLSKMPAGDSTKRGFTQTIVDYIGANLLDAPSILNQNLGTNVPLADNLIKSASKVVVQRGRFFDTKSSSTVASVYNYFAAYQTKLAVLLTEYFHAKPEVYSPTNVAASIAALEGNVNAQAGSLKPTVPKDTVVDVRHRTMWTKDIPGSAEVNLHAIAEIYQPRRGHQRFRLTGGAGPRGLQGLPFSNWQVPSIGAFEQLIAGWSGGNPAEWLGQKADISKRLLDASGGHMWVRDGFRMNPGTFNRLDIDVFHLRKGTTFPKPASIWFFADGWRQDFDGTRAGLIFYRELPADETYWWTD
jgi:hypothetical protein